MTQTRLQTQYYFAPDLMRIFCILAVILIHSSTRILEITHFDVKNLQITLLLNQLSRYAVPVFFAISGFVLELSFIKNKNLVDYYKKRVSRLLLPYLVWSGVYYFFIYTKHSSSFLQALTDGSSSYQLYFIPALLLFYLLFPLLHALVRVFSNKFVLIGLWICQMLILHADYTLNLPNIFYPVSVGMFNFFIFMVGMVVAEHQTKINQSVWRYKLGLIVLTVVLGYLVFREGFINYLTTNNYRYFYSQWRPSVLIYSLALFLGGIGILPKLKLNANLIRKIANLCLFVFFSHVVVLEFLWKHIFAVLFVETAGIIAQSIWFNLGFFFLVASASFVLAALIHKIPLLAKLTG